MHIVSETSNMAQRVGNFGLPLKIVPSIKKLYNERFKTRLVIVRIPVFIKLLDFL